MCILVHIMINQHVQAIKHILKESQQLLQTFENYKASGKKLFLYTGDFSSLYTSMKPIHVVNSISNYLLKETNILSEFKMSIFGFRKILFLIFTCNIFVYNSHYFLQKIGQPMGIMWALCSESLFIYSREKVDES